MDVERVKVVHLAPLGAGGISKLTVTINKLIDRNKIRFDYLVFRNQKEFMEDEILKLGSKKQIIDTTNINNKLVKAIKKINWMRQLFKREKYDVVHVDASTPYDVIVAISAKLAGVKVIVLHSHNDNFERSMPLRDAFMWFYKLLMPLVITNYFAISEKAAEFMFPKKVFKSKNYKIVCNGINTDEYLYEKEDRDIARKELGVEKNFVLGHVGRFVYQKNHDYILDVFEKLLTIRPEAKLLLVGDGELQESIKEKVKRKKLEENVIFYGTTHDVRKVLIAMDAFIFPSHFEGLGIVAIEAQATGLPTFCADSIVEEVNITKCFHRIHGWNPDEWAKKISEVTVTANVRRSYNKEIADAGYDIRVVAQELQNFYIKSGREI